MCLFFFKSRLDFYELLKRKKAIEISISKDVTQNTLTDIFNYERAKCNNPHLISTLT